MKEPLAMQEVHKIRRQLAKEWKTKTKKEIRLERRKIDKIIKKLNLEKIEYITKI
ncbi:MAG: hypothetical protein QXP52_03235 [Candidatus Aenigmatarchaeota archaeon]